jgi:16S rRNA (guanine527-N7)-methyltransferase
MVDIGTGAGFPGIILKIQNPELELTLAEPRPNRIQFLNDVIRELQLKKISVFGHKVTSNSFSSPVSMVITRALETIDKTILRSSGAVNVGTQLVFMKGPNVDQELKEALKLFGNYYQLKEDKAYNLPKSNQQRRLVTLECIKKPDSSFSRYKN